MVQLLKQETLRLRGFPLALQLLAYHAVPKLQSTIPIPFDSRTIMDLDGPNLPFYPAPSAIDIIRVEADPDLQVTSLIPIHIQPQPGWGVWPDVSNDDHVSYMEQLIADHRPFTKDLWHGGVTSEPFITTTTNDEDQLKAKKTKPEAPPKNAYKPKPLTKKVLKARKTSKKKDTVHKQRRISCYFHAAAPSSTSEDKILELLSAISDQRSAFNTLLGEGLVKKGNTALAHKGCQTEATNVNVPVSSHDVCHTEPKADSSYHTLQAPMEEDHSHSPVVSQYAAQLYGSTSHSKSTTDEPVHATSIHASPIHPSPIPASPIHTSPIHNSQTPSSPITHPPYAPNPTTPPSLRPCSAIYDASAHPNSSEAISPVHDFFNPQKPPVQSPPVHNSTLSTHPYAPNPTTPPSLRPCSAIYDASAHPNSPEAITPDPPPPPVLSQPQYDTSCNQSSLRRIFPLSPLHLTPELDSLPGFVGHATAINAFSATATSKPSSVPKTQHFSAVQAQPTDDSDIVSLSDGSPAPQTPKHIPSMEEDHLAKQLLCCKTVLAPDLLSPLPQIEWDPFEKIIPKFSAAFHITPSKLDFSNNFLLQLAQPMN
ncbi:hypothetical protein Bca101_088968 [Brassica carinata]